MYSKIVKQINLVEVLNALQKDFNNAFLKGKTILSHLIHIHKGLELDIFEIPKSSVRANVKHMEKVLSDHGVLIEEEFKLLFDTLYFVSSLCVLFPKVPRPIKNRIDKFNKTNQNVLERLAIIESKLTFKFDLDYVMTMDLKHMKKLTKTN